jgi:hypothetical protein
VREASSGALRKNGGTLGHRRVRTARAARGFQRPVIDARLVCPFELYGVKVFRALSDGRSALSPPAFRQLRQFAS